MVQDSSWLIEVPVEAEAAQALFEEFLNDATCSEDTIALWTADPRDPPWSDYTKAEISKKDLLEDGEDSYR